MGPVRLKPGVLQFTSLNPFPNDKFYTLPNRKSLQTTISNLTKMEKKVLQTGTKLVMSNFSFSKSVFKILVLQTRKNQGLFGKRVSFTAEPHRTPSRDLLILQSVDTDEVDSI